MPFLLYRGRQGSSSQLSSPRLASTRVRTDEACSATLAGWLLSWCGGRVFTKICMPPPRCLLSWPGGRTSPRRCSLSWPGCRTSPRRCSPSWWAGSCVGTAVEPWRVWPGCGPADVFGKSLAGAPARVLPRRRGCPWQGSCQGVSWVSSARILSRIFVF